jgi:uncharacterized membrane protein
MSELPVPRRLPRRTYDWLFAESRRWVDEGVLDDAGRMRILSQYGTESSSHRGTMALTLVAVLMCGIGVLLVIGYNWDRIPASAKVAMIMVSIASAFGAAAAAYARGRRTLAEVLAFSGTVLFGNGIWLIAQVLHIQGHFPDAFLWFSVGAFVTACLVESAAIGVGASLLAGVWIISEASFYAHVIYPFLVLWPCAVWVAYRIRSTVMVYVLGLTVALWVGIATVPEARMTVAPAAVLLSGCALYAIARWHRAESEMADGWRISALGTLLLTLMPFMSSGLYHSMEKGTAVSSIVIAASAAAIAASAVARPIRIPADWAVLVTGSVALVWALVAGSGLLSDTWWLKTVSTIAFSTTALVLCVALIRSAFRSNRTSDLAFGVLFGLAFLIMRWTSMIENLLWSGLVLLVAGGGLLLIARQWLRRDRSLLVGRAS